MSSSRGLYNAPTTFECITLVAVILYAVSSIITQLNNDAIDSLLFRKEFQLFQWFALRHLKLYRRDFSIANALKTYTIYPLPIDMCLLLKPIKMGKSGSWRNTFSSHCRWRWLISVCREVVTHAYNENDRKNVWFLFIFLSLSLE